MNQRELENLACRIAADLRTGDNIFLIGELGAGKSVFARAFMRYLGVKGNIPSPSFIIHASYEASGRTIHHIDLYRLSGRREELEQYGVLEALDSSAIVILEWADRLEEGLLEKGIVISIDFGRDQSRRKVTVDDRRMAGA